MRVAGVFFLLVGLVAIVVGTFTGCGSLFSWNGRHEIEVIPLDDTALHHVLVPVPGRRYTLAVEVSFDRDGLDHREDGVVQVDAKMPLVVTVKDQAGTSLASAAGWVDPSEAPNVLRGQSARPTRGGMPDLAVSRIVGPFGAASSAPLTIDVNLGPDRIGKAKITERRLVIHDDALPPAIRNAFIVAVVGSLSIAGGVVLLIAGWFRRRAPRRTAASLVRNPPDGG